MNTAHPGYEVADVFRLYGQSFRQNNPISNTQDKVMRHIEFCRTAALGGHVEQCDQCGFERISYNSAGTGIAPSAKHWSKKSGLAKGYQNCCPADIFTSSSPCPTS
jgi:hypothetical protein